MQMQVEYGLSCARIAIHRKPIAWFRDTLLSRDLLRRHYQFANDYFVPWLQIVHSCNVAPRYHQHVRRGLRVYITKSYYMIRLKQQIRRNIAARYLAKQTVI